MSSQSELSHTRLYTLDALRGVAAFIVIWFHIFEGFATTPADQMINHGYLAVDFFFLLSGYVIGFSYDSRWNEGKLSRWEFLKRRFIRLHPMVIAGVLIGAIAFILGGSQKWSGEAVSFVMVLAACLFNVFLLPALPGSMHEVRGNHEMFPLNGPHWSLFFEYIANILYAVFVRRLNNLWLGILTALSALTVLYVLFGNMTGYYNMSVGWSAHDNNLWGGLARVMFSFTAGLLMARTFRRRRLPYAFLWCSVILFVVTFIPYAGTASHPWLNALYDTIVILVIFPLVLAMGASAIEDGKRNRFKSLVGELSYPLYAIHYPLMYLFYGWLWSNELTFGETWHVAIAIVFSAIILAWLLLIFYDRPVRRYLGKRYLEKKH